jgi:hypothetical protein
MRGQIEKTDSVVIIKRGESIVASSASLLKTLNIKAPATQITVKAMYIINKIAFFTFSFDNDVIIEPEIALKICPDTVTKSLSKAIHNICCFSFATNSVSPLLFSLQPFASVLPNTDDLQFFHSQGYWSSPIILQSAQIQRAKDKISQLFLETETGCQSNHLRSQKIVNASQLDESIREIVYNPIIGQIVAKLMGIIGTCSS